MIYDSVKNKYTHVGGFESLVDLQFIEADLSLVGVEYHPGGQGVSVGDSDVHRPEVPGRQHQAQVGRDDDHRVHVSRALPPSTKLTSPIKVNNGSKPPSRNKR